MGEQTIDVALAETAALNEVLVFNDPAAAS
jgi:hypothetical protein